MSDSSVPLLHVLTIDDSEDDLDGLLERLSEEVPEQIAEYQLDFEGCVGFDEGLRKLKDKRYDIVMTDFYVNRGEATQEPKGTNVVEAIQGIRFCPVVVFSSGSKHESIQENAFVRFPDRSGGTAEIVQCLEEVLGTGIPTIANKLHEELDAAGSKYLWEFLKENWDSLKKNGIAELPVLERLIRRRASIQIGRLAGCGKTLFRTF